MKVIKVSKRAVALVQAKTNASGVSAKMVPDICKSSQVRIVRDQNVSHPGNQNTKYLFTSYIQADQATGPSAS